MIPLHPHLQNHVHGSGYRVKGLRPLRGLGQRPRVLQPRGLFGSILAVWRRSFFHILSPGKGMER